MADELFDESVWMIGERRGSKFWVDIVDGHLRFTIADHALPVTGLVTDVHGQLTHWRELTIDINQADLLAKTLRTAVNKLKKA